MLGVSKRAKCDKCFKTIAVQISKYALRWIIRESFALLRMSSDNRDACWRHTYMGQELDELRYLRLPEIIGCKRRGIRGLYPVSASHWWAGVQSGRYPKQVKLSARVSAWKSSDIRELLSRGTEGAK